VRRVSLAGIERIFRSHLRRRSAPLTWWARKAARVCIATFRAELKGKAARIKRAAREEARRI